MKVTDYQCMCGTKLTQREERIRILGAGPVIYGPGEIDNWGTVLSKPFCPNCGLVYDLQVILGRIQ